MAPLPPSNSERWWLVYQVNGDTHRLMMRTATGATAANVSLTLHGLINRMAPDLNLLTPLNLEYAFINSNVRNTALWSQAASYGAGDESTNDGRARSASFVGRAISGRRARLFLYGFKRNASGDYRTNIEENAQVLAAVAYLNGANGAFLAVDRSQPTYKGYVNVGYNDHWVKVARRG